jgi:hypothetical protein
MTGTYPQELNSHCEKMIQFIQDYPLEPTMRLELGHRNENHLFGFLSFYLRLSIENDSKTKKKTLPSWLSLSPFVLLDKLLVILCNQSATGNLQYRYYKNYSFYIITFFKIIPRFLEYPMRGGNLYGF